MTRAEEAVRQSDLPTTSVTLVEELGRPENREAYNRAWMRFHTRYSPVIYQWFRTTGRLDPETAQELTQAFHVRLVKSMRSFRYDASQKFRGWLRVCVRNHVNSFFRDRREDLHLGEDGGRWLEAVETLDERLQREFDLELWELAKERVRRRVGERDWGIYEATGERDQSCEAVAAERGLTQGTVYTVRWRVKMQLKLEVERLMRTGGRCRTDGSGGSAGVSDVIGSDDGETSEPDGEST